MYMSHPYGQLARQENTEVRTPGDGVQVLTITITITITVAITITSTITIIIVIFRLSGGGNSTPRT